MGVEQYQQHDWSPTLWALLLLLLALSVIATMSLFLVMASRSATSGRAARHGETPAPEVEHDRPVDEVEPPHAPAA